jgi:putative ABC transport system permease protein
MMWLRSLGDRLTGLLGRGRVDSELKEEFEFHLEMEVASNLRAGMSPEEARRKALLAFGSRDWFTERVREERGMTLIEDILRDLSFGFRNLRKRPTFALAAILTLSLGIGMTTTMFSLVDMVLLRPLPGSNAEGMVYLSQESVEREIETSPTPQLLRVVRDHASSFSQIEAYTSENLNLEISGEPYRTKGATASVGFFSFLGVTPVLGRGFFPEDGMGASAPVAILSYSFWVERFGQSRSVLGQTLGINDRIHEIIGVLPPDFRLDNRIENSLWIPEGAAGVLFTDGAPVEGALAKLAQGVSLEVARAELDAIVRNNPLEQRANIGWIGTLRTPRDLIDPTFMRTVLILQVSAVLVLLIGCGNLTNLLLAQGEVRSKELALRASLGARRGRLVRQLLVESLVLGFLGGVGGIFLTLWAMNALPVFLPPGYSGVSPSPVIFLFASLVSLVSVFVVGILPALRGSKRGLNEVIKGETPLPLGPLRRIGVRQLLVTAEVAMAFVLLVSAGLLLKSFSGLNAIEPGFDRENLMTLRVDLPEERYGEEEAQLTFFHQLLDGVQRSLPPQLGTATLSSGLVENVQATFAPLIPEGGQTQESEQLLLLIKDVAPGYFGLMGLPLLQGREFVEGDGRDEEAVMIINEGVARRYFPDSDPVGRRIRMREDWFRVVGVAKSVQLPGSAQSKHGDLQLYFPYAQSPGRGLTIVARVGGDRSAAVDLLKEAVRALDPSLPIQKVALVDDLLAESLAQERSNALLMGLFALTALVLGAVGIYGVVAYSVSQRIREIGIRVALGASKGEVVSRVVVGGMKTVMAGLVLGALGAAALGTTLSRLLHEVDPRDPTVFLGVMAAIAGVSLLATWLPARRAAGSGPLESLRSE